MPVTFGEGELGTIVGKNGFRYQLQWDDLLWLGRSLTGEAGTSNRQEHAAVLWCYAQRAVLRRAGTGSGITVVNGERVDTGTSSGFSKMVATHSQPINPLWRRDGYFCRVGGPAHGQDRCSPDKLDRRDRMKNLTWDTLSPNVKASLIDWARGRTPNPIPRHVDFAAGPTSSGRITTPNSPYRNGPPPLFGGTRVTPNGNVFYKQYRPASKVTTGWDSDHVKIIFNGSESGVQETTGATPEVTERPETTRESRVFVREVEITSDRREPPTSQRQYSTLSGSTEDPQAAHILSREEEELRIMGPRDLFYKQVEALKAASTLEIAQAVPIIEIKTQDEDGNIVNLNELIFSKSPFYELQAEDNQGSFDHLPERPLASIKNLQFKIETPPAGGETSIYIGKLSLKIHSPDKVNTNHPRGKYISWMMRSGFYMRIRFGVSMPTQAPGRDVASLAEAFQWKERDFYVRHYNLNINDDGTYDLDIEIMPSADSLFAQIHIGESIPFTEGDGDSLTEDDFSNILSRITSDISTAEQREEIQTRLRAFWTSFNQGQRTVGYRTHATEDSNGVVTIGSVLHGAIRHSNILEQREGRPEVPIHNMVDGLKSVQSILLTRRIERILEEDTYRTELKGVEHVVVNMGSLVEKLALPEFVQIASYINQENLQIGEVNSLDYTASETPTRRDRVNLVFGIFNQKAGQWANRPISEIPININAIFGFMREAREVGQFGNTINAFIRKLGTIVNESSNFIAEGESNPEEGEDQNTTSYRLENPQIKYTFTADPQDPGAWVLYIFDDKRRSVEISELLGFLHSGDGTLPREEIIEKLDSLHVPHLDLGSEGSVIKNMTAKTISNDRLLAHNMLRTNTSAVSSRETDGSNTIAPGINPNFINGMQNDPQRIIRATTIILPVEVSITTYIMTSANLFLPIYLFLPTKMLEGVYQANTINTEIRDGFLETKFELFINTTRANIVST